MEYLYNKFCYISLFIYLFLLIKENFYLIFSYDVPIYIKKLNIYLLIFVYLYETFVMFIFKKSILINWNLKNYIEHHVGSSIGLIYVLYNNIPLNYFENMQKYVILINIIEFTRVLQNWNISNSCVYFNLFIGLYYLLHLIYYEIYESYIYFIQKDTPNKYIVIYPIIFAFYHTFVILPFLIKKQKYLCNIIGNKIYNIIKY